MHVNNIRFVNAKLFKLYLRGGGKWSVSFCFKRNLVLRETFPRELVGFTSRRLYSESNPQSCCQNELFFWILNLSAYVPQPTIPPSTPSLIDLIHHENHSFTIKHPYLQPFQFQPLPLERNRKSGPTVNPKHNH